MKENCKTLSSSFYLPFIGVVIYEKESREGADFFANCFADFTHFQGYYKITTH